MKKFEYHIVYFVKDFGVREDFGIILGESCSDAWKNLEKNIFYSVKDDIIEINIIEKFDDNIIKL